MVVRPVPSMPEYGATENGQIVRLTKGWGVAAGKVLSQFKNTRGGHRRVQTVHGPKLVHVMVCEAFHGPAPEDKPFALHRDDDPDNNVPSNLRWGTKQDNADDRRRNKGYRTAHRVVPFEKAEHVRSLIGMMSERRIAAVVGVTRGFVIRIKQGYRSDL